MIEHSSDPSSQPQPQPRNKVQSFFAIRPLKRLKLKEFIGKSYALAHSEKYEQFLQQLGATEEVYKAAAKIQPKLTLKKEYDGFALITSFPDFPRKIVKFKDKLVFERELQSGAIVKSSFEIKENTVTEVQDWDNKRVVISRTFGPNELIVTMEVNGVKCYRHYKKAEPEDDMLSDTTTRNSQLLEEAEESLSFTPKQEEIMAMSDSEEVINLCF